MKLPKIVVGEGKQKALEASQIDLAMLTRGRNSRGQRNCRSSMPEYEGFVASLKEDGKAEVIVQPETSGIVGAPGASNKVCHCASSSSQVTVEALNPLQAGVGDRVVVRVDTSLLLRNAGALVGIPALALLLGWAVSFFTPESEWLGVPFRFLCLFFSLPLGIAAGVVLYRHWSRRNLPNIIRIIKTCLGGSPAPEKN